MAAVDFKRVRAQVTEFWSDEPVTDRDLVQQLVEWHSPLKLPYPPVTPIDPAQGIWDLFFPEDVLQEFNKQAAREFELEAVERYFRVRFL